MANTMVWAEIQLIKVKVPLICLGTEGVSPRRDGRYILCLYLGQTLAVRGGIQCVRKAPSRSGLSPRVPLRAH